MRGLAAPWTITAVVLSAGCTSQQAGVAPTPGAAIEARAGESIFPGQSVAGTFVGNPIAYTLASATDGKLTIRLTWDPTKDGGRLMLTAGDTSVRAASPDFSPVISVLQLSAGRTYRIVVDEAYAPWDYGFHVPFTLATSLEPGAGGPFDY